jgi:Reverse transcriptase (RNA-dependent DNA polymerase)
MFEEGSSNLPIQLATRLLLDNVSYGNALPEWFETLTIDRVERERRIAKRVDEYLSGVSPSKPLEILVPKRNGKSNLWIVPSINDQIICQACVSTIAETLERKHIDRTKVFSSRLNRDPNRLAFIEDQVPAWAHFQTEIGNRCSSVDCVLQIDLKDAFESIRIESFNSFVDRSSVDPIAARLLRHLVQTLSASSRGLPFLNDSIFFLGNAFFSEVDEIVARHNPNFVRFVDDYKIFGPSRSALELQFSAIRKDIQTIGFEVSESKIWLGSGEEYLEAASKLRYALTGTDNYVQPTAQPEIIEPSAMLAQIKSCLEKPNDYLHQGFGRFQMAAIRRMRVRGLYSDAKSLGASPSSQFAELLAGDAAAINLICDLLVEYSGDDSNTWRLIWLLCLCKSLNGVPVNDKPLRQKLDDVIRGINRSQKVAPVSRLWATAMPEFPGARRKWIDAIEDLHALDYLDRGKRCYGV